MLNDIDLSRADLNLLVLFETVMDTRHVGRAADRLNLTPSAVSHGLGRLRSLLGDPLFLKTPKGVAPSERAVQLAPAVADILARVRNVVASAKPFNPAIDTRRFTIGAPDAASHVFLPPLLTALRRSAPAIDISIRQLLPKPGQPSPNLAWSNAFSDLEARAMDVAVLPTSEAPARFATRALYEEDFVAATRAKHPFTADPSLAAYCAARHLVVSDTGDAFGFVDTALAAKRRSRRVALTVPNFMFALAVLAQTDLVSALPRRFVAMHGRRFGVIGTEVPVKLPHFKLSVITPRAALEDAGVSWLVEMLQRSVTTLAS